MTALHIALAYLATGVALVVLTIALLAVVLPARVRVFLDRLILACVAVLFIGLLSGLPLLLLAGGRPDVMHLVYGAVAPAILLGGRYLGRSGDMRRRAAFVAVAALALLGVIYRLFTTAGPG